MNIKIIFRREPKARERQKELFKAKNFAKSRIEPSLG
jgi:hypothetical protein